MSFMNNVMDRMMFALKRRCTFLNTRWCNALIGLIVFLNPIAMIPQLRIAFTAPPNQVAGISVSTFLIFASIQAAIVGSAIKSMDWRLFWSMTISFFLSLLVAIIALVRT